MDRPYHPLNLTHFQSVGNKHNMHLKQPPLGGGGDGVQDQYRTHKRGR
jgi:hypothetical protein